MKKYILSVSIILEYLIIGLFFYFAQININKDNNVKKIRPDQYWMGLMDDNPNNAVCDLKVSSV